MFGNVVYLEVALFCVTIGLLLSLWAFIVWRPRVMKRMKRFGERIQILEEVMSEQTENVTIAADQYSELVNEVQNVKTAIEEERQQVKDEMATASQKLNQATVQIGELQLQLQNTGTVPVQAVKDISTLLSDLNDCYVNVQSIVNPDVPTTTSADQGNLFPTDTPPADSGSAPADATNPDASTPASTDAAAPTDTSAPADAASTDATASVSTDTPATSDLASDEVPDYTKDPVEEADPQGGDTGFVNVSPTDTPADTSTTTPSDAAPATTGEVTDEDAAAVQAEASADVTSDDSGNSAQG